MLSVTKQFSILLDNEQHLVTPVYQDFITNLAALKAAFPESDIQVFTEVLKAHSSPITCETCQSFAMCQTISGVTPDRMACSQYQRGCSGVR